VKRGDPDGFLARLSIVSPRTVSFAYDEFEKNDDAANIEDILRKIMTDHSTPKLQYTFSEDALQVFKAFFNKLRESQDERDVFTEGEQRSIISKMQVSFTV
jgi:hypothetical protein